MTEMKELADELSSLLKSAGWLPQDRERVLAALSGNVAAITDADGIAWFERTFGVPLGDVPGRLDVERVRAAPSGKGAGE